MHVQSSGARGATALLEGLENQQTNMHVRIAHALISRKERFAKPSAPSREGNLVSHQEG